ncbi:MAG: glucose-6-phosphate isomerase [Planctomycetota bacterium]
MNNDNPWQRFQKQSCMSVEMDLRLDYSRMIIDNAAFDRMMKPIADALDAMRKLEAGAIANPDENRMVGHYWLRAPQLAPTAEIRREIESSIQSVKRFSREVLDGLIRPEGGDEFLVVLVVGIGGSALGPQFVSDALGTDEDPMIVRFIDNTDPEGIDRVLAELDELLPQTLTIVVSKSGTTIETRNGMLEVAAAYKKAGLNFGKHAIAVTCEGSSLQHIAVAEKWLHVFPMWDWVGGRTSVLSAAGLLPLALQGIDIDALLSGARGCDIATRLNDIRKNPAAMMSLIWHQAGDGHGRRNMVVLPYRDRLVLFGRYLQQLVMESLGKSKDRAGNPTPQGLTVFGNKGSTDQHAFVQQLRDGPDDFFVVFLETLHDRNGLSMVVEENVTTGDYLHHFLYGTRDALTESGKRSMTLTLDELNARSVGVLIALFERAVGLYAELINVNAYHQPGVEAGKKAAANYVALQHVAVAHLESHRDLPVDCEAIALAIGQPEAAEAVYHILEHAAANPDHGVIRVAGPTRFADTFYVPRESKKS